MNAEDLLLSTKSLLDLTKMQAEMEGRDFTVNDALIAIRPALESVLSELLDLQRVAPKCPHCKTSLTLKSDELPIEDYDSLDATDIKDAITDMIDAGEITDDEIKQLHSYESANQRRGSVLSHLTDVYGTMGGEGQLDNEDDREQRMDDLFKDLFAK